MTDETRTNAPAMLASGLVLGAVLFLVAAVYSSFTIIQPGKRRGGVQPVVTHGRSSTKRS